MRPALARIAAALAALSLLTSCSGGDGGTGTTVVKGRLAADVCGGLAGEAAVASALKDLTGAERFHDDLSDPEKGLALLRDASRAPLADSYHPQAVPYCWLLSVEKGDKRDGSPEGATSIRFEVAPISKAPGLGPGRADEVTSFASGVLAYASDDFARVYFPCRPRGATYEIIVETTVWSPRGMDETASGDVPTRLITVANAAARQVSAKLGCTNDRLAVGVPAPTQAS